jgi:hypothetical protein
MSAELMSTSQEQPRTSIAQRIQDTSDSEFMKIYATLLQISGTNRHSSPEIQVRAILEIEWDELELIIKASIIAMRRQDE